MAVSMCPVSPVVPRWWDRIRSTWSCCRFLHSEAAAARAPIPVKPRGLKLRLSSVMDERQAPGPMSAAMPCRLMPLLLTLRLRVL
eukprot:2250040-Rhodomonas_salina.1